MKVIIEMAEILGWEIEDKGRVLEFKLRTPSGYLAINHFPTEDLPSFMEELKKNYIQYLEILKDSIEEGVNSVYLPPRADQYWLIEKMNVLYTFSQMRFIFKK